MHCLFDFFEAINLHFCSQQVSLLDQVCIFTWAFHDQCPVYPVVDLFILLLFFLFLSKQPNN